MEALEAAAEQIVPGLIDEPAWPTLRAHLLLLAAHGTDPVAQLSRSRGQPGTQLRRRPPPSWTGGWTATGSFKTPARACCRGCPASRKGCATIRRADYLAARSDLVRTLADQAGATITDTDPPAEG